jgi:hypothetical protein
MTASARLVPSKTRLTEDDCRNVTWEVVETTPHYRRSVGRGTHPDTGLPIEVQRTEWLADEQLQDENRQLYDASFGKRFGDGVGVGRIPLNLFFSEIAPRLQAGDKDYMRWFLNRDQNLPFRTFRGRI